MIPRKYKELLQAVGAYADKLGIKAWVVGGAVRDFYLGRDTQDLDLTFEGSPESVAGVAATWDAETLTLSYDGVMLDAGPYADTDMSPLWAG